MQTQSEGGASMNRTARVSAITGLALLLASPLAPAATINLFATLDGSQEVPSNGSAGTGTGVLVYDDISNLLEWNISWSGLSGDATGMHFHGPAAPGVNAGIQVNIGAISGLTSPSIGSTTITEPQESELLGGLWYINIHTNEFMGGEIRGQVQVVPVPAAAWLFGTGLVGLYGFMRHRRSR
jgi:hypothetical protein